MDKINETVIKAFFMKFCWTVIYKSKHLCCANVWHISGLYFTFYCLCDKLKLTGGEFFVLQRAQKLTGGSTRRAYLSSYRSDNSKTLSESTLERKYDVRARRVCAFGNRRNLSGKYLNRFGNEKHFAFINAFNSVFFCKHTRVELVNKIVNEQYTHGL